MFKILLRLIGISIPKIEDVVRVILDERDERERKRKELENEPKTEENEKS